MDPRSWSTKTIIAVAVLCAAVIAVLGVWFVTRPSAEDKITARVHAYYDALAIGDYRRACDQLAPSERIIVVSGTDQDCPAVMQSALPREGVPELRGVHVTAVRTSGTIGVAVLGAGQSMTLERQPGGEWLILNPGP